MRGMEPLRLTTYEPSPADKKFAAFGVPLFVLFIWGMLAVLFFNSDDVLIRSVCVAGAVAAAIGAVFMAAAGVKKEEAILEGRSMRVLTTRGGKISEASYGLTPDCRASVEPVVTVRGGNAMAVVLATAHGGSCWIAAGAVLADKERVAEQINDYLSISG